MSFMHLMRISVGFLPLSFTLSFSSYVFPYYYPANFSLLSNSYEEVMRAKNLVGAVRF
jgi:hypothetical protein